MKNGSLYCSIAVPYPGMQYYNFENSAEYFNGDASLLYYDSSKREHAVSIIGWDDNYPKENFNENIRPANDGAYIVMNSWGESWGNNGILYVSYEDKYIVEDINGITSATIDINEKTEQIEFKDSNLYNEIKRILN